MRLHVVASLLLPFTCGCAGAVPASEPEPAPPRTDGPKGPASEGEGDAGDDTEGEEPVICDEIPVPASLVAYNVASTDYSGFVRIDSAEVVGAYGGPPAATGYVNHRYRVTVIETVRGFAGTGFILMVMAEADSRPMDPGAVVFVSLCRNEDDTYHPPDNGYIFPAPDSFAKAVGKLEIPPTPEGRPTACEE